MGQPNLLRFPKGSLTWNELSSLSLRLLGNKAQWVKKLGKSQKSLIQQCDRSELCLQKLIKN